MLTKVHFCKMAGKNVFIHPSSIVDEGAAIGDGTKIWHFSHLMPACSVGKNCTIGQNVFIDIEFTLTMV